MIKDLKRIAYILLAAFSLWSLATAASADLIRGIYLSQATLEDTPYLNYLITHAKAAGITTFVVDLERPDAKYKSNIALLKQNNIHYVARIVVFPDGGRPDQIASSAYWAKRYELIKEALVYGADKIQLDYIRYNTKQPASIENAKNIFKVLQWYRSQLATTGVPLEADVFGIASFGPSNHIGQDLPLMARAVDALCPMVYPSHYIPYEEHSQKPYETVYGSLKSISAQFQGKPPVKIFAYIELSNFRFPVHGEERLKYIAAEIKAVEDAGADGWYAWSAHNQYDYLFRLLEEANKTNKNDGNTIKTVETKQPASTTPSEKLSLAPTAHTETVAENLPAIIWPLGASIY